LNKLKKYNKLQRAEINETLNVEARVRNPDSDWPKSKFWILIGKSRNPGIDRRIDL